LSAQLPTELPTGATNPMRACSDTQLPTAITDGRRKSGGIFKILVRKSIKYQRISPTEFNATTQKNIILLSVGNSVGKITV
jgi:hypothetical protein